MAISMKLKAVLKGDVAEITVLATHPMETGMRKDGPPAHFVQVVTVDIGGKRVATSNLNAAVSQNPFLKFKVKGVNVGDKVVAACVDNRGDKGTVEGAVAAG